MQEELILIGGGGHCRSCIDVIERAGKHQICGVLDLPEQVGGSVLGYTIVGTELDFAAKVRERTLFLITIGQIRTAEKRVKLYQKLRELGASLAIVVSPLGYVSPRASIGEGTIVMHGAHVNAGARVGANCIINTGAVVEHDVIIESHCHVAPGAVVNGGVHVHERSFIGSQAMVREGVVIGEGCFIGARCTVRGNVERESILKP